MVCDEVWEYDEAAGSATISGLRLLCPDCNAVTHIGNLRARRGQGAEQAAIKHMAAVNDTTFEEAEQQVKTARAVWRRQSLIKDWRIQIRGDVLLEFPELEDIARL